MSGQNYPVEKTRSKKNRFDLEDVSFKKYREETAAKRSLERTRIEGLRGKWKHCYQEHRAGQTYECLSSGRDRVEEVDAI